jgi:uncharacterized membrane protein YoaK (UPF0700 family)
LRSRTRFGLGILLTALAGWVDAIGFISLGGFYVSFMSGNTTQLGIGLTRFDAGLVALPTALLASFVFGAYVATVVSNVAGRWSLPATLLVEGLFLASALLLSVFAIPIVSPTGPLAIAMGTQNAALRTDSGHRIGGTFVTGTVFGLGEALALWCLGQAGPRPALGHALGWAALAAGAAAGTWAFSAYGLLALTVPAGCVLSLAGITGLMTLTAGGRPAGEERRDEAS